jgi:hypothetical protein
MTELVSVALARTLGAPDSEYGRGLGLVPESWRDDMLDQRVRVGLCEIAVSHRGAVMVLEWGD